jgi:hypothetical protein
MSQFEDLKMKKVIDTVFFFAPWRLGVKPI